MNLEKARFNMVEQQIRPWEVLDPGVLGLLFEVKRELFVPAPHAALAFADMEIPLGHGESMMRLCLAKTAIDWMRQGVPAEDAARRAIALIGERTGGSGGTILIDRSGRLGWARNTATMSWAACASDWADTQSGV